MSRADRARGTRLVVAAAMAVLASHSVAVAQRATGAQRATVPELKAAYLHNFAKFIEWPRTVLAPGKPIVLCVVNDREVADILTGLTSGAVIDDHAVVVTTVKAEEPTPAACLMLFASGLDISRWRVLLESVRHKPVLTVGDREPSIELGAIVGFFVQKDRLGFAINLDAAQRAGLKLSSKLLSLAVIAKDDPDRKAR